MHQEVGFADRQDNPSHAHHPQGKSYVLVSNVDNLGATVSMLSLVCVDDVSLSLVCVGVC